MLDIKFVVENHELVNRDIKKRGKEYKLDNLKAILDFYPKWKKIKQDLDDLRNKRNIISENINKLKKEGKDIKGLVTEIKELPERIKLLDLEEVDLRVKLHENLRGIPNILHSSVKKGKDSAENTVAKKFGKISKPKFRLLNHIELIEKNNWADFEAAAKVAGRGFYYLKNDLALLNQALIRFTIDFMLKKGYTYIETPLMIYRDVLDAAMNSEEFEKSIYSLKNDNLNMIGTSEHSLLGMHKGDVLSEKDIPKKYFSYSMCFRREIGSHGINEKGLWRTHQFNKIEQFIFCKPEDSYKYYAELLKNTEEIFRKLKIPYRVLEMCSGDTADWKAKTCDVEAYRPTLKQYGEVGSLTNCTDYQSRDLNIRYVNKKGEQRVLHTLNNTAVATSRVMVAILENYQQKDGTVKVPKVLMPYMHGRKIIGKK